MTLFREQPLYCPNCGTRHGGEPERPQCSMECFNEIQWKQTLYIMGKEYYPRATPKPGTNVPNEGT